MAINRGPSIVTDGLVLHLDAADRNSYSGSGNTWFDLSGQGNHGTLTNGPTFSSANNGSLVFDGINDRVSLSTLLTSTFTYDVWAYNTPSGADNDYGYFFSGSDGRGLAVSEGGNAIGLVSGDLYYVNGSAPINLFVSISDNKWVNISCIVDGVYKTIKIYKNGIFMTLSNVINTQINITNFGVYIATNSHWWNGKFGSKKIYNRALSADEVRRNYNATKGRYGLS